MNANEQVDKMRRALTRLRNEMQEAGEHKQVEAINAVLASEMSVLRLAAIMTPQN